MNASEILISILEQIKIDSDYLWDPIWDPCDSVSDAHVLINQKCKLFERYYELSVEFDSSTLKLISRCEFGMHYFGRKYYLNEPDSIERAIADLQIEVDVAIEHFRSSFQ